VANGPTVTIALYRGTGLLYKAAMADRPCMPDADVKWLWRFLLPDTPFPACGTPETAADSDGGAGAAADPTSDFGSAITVEIVEKRSGRQSR
ncbi:MAG: hypothetical protein WA177_15130, partial [Xanthobacteraceae bacterium]